MATVITGNVILSLRRYFLGVTIVATFNAIVVGVAAVLLDVPLAGTIAVVVFVTAYIPFIGAFISGAFAVLLTLSSQGTTAAAIMLVVVILANGLLQNIVQPIAFGATLDLNPLVVLIVTIGFGSLFGMIGMVLAAPLTSAAIHISKELAAARAAEEAARMTSALHPSPVSEHRLGREVHRLRREPDRRAHEEAVAEAEECDPEVAGAESRAEGGEEEGDREEHDCEHVAVGALDVTCDHAGCTRPPAARGASALADAASLYCGIANGDSGASGFSTRLRREPGIEGRLELVPEALAVER